MFANLIYLFAILAVSPFLMWRAICGGRYRRGISEKLFGLSASKAEHLLPDSAPGSDRLWYHAVSVGEVNLLTGLVRKLDAEASSSFVVSTSTDTGYDLAVKHFGREHVFFCPLDFTWAVNKTLKHLRPTKLILVELELWPNLIRSANRLGCNVLVVNARLSDRSAHRYQKFSFYTRRLFAGLDWVGCQDSEVLSHFQACGTPRENLEITGSLKFDNAPNRRDTPEVLELEQWLGKDATHHVWLVGSTQPGEEAMALSIFRRLATDHPSLRLILVPRHPQRFDEVARLIETQQLIPRRRSSQTPPPSTWNQNEVVLIDTIGELRHWWGTAQIATVGGSFGSRGGQNMLEPAGYGVAVSFGPDTRNFKQIAQTLLREEAARRVNDEPEMESFVQQCLIDPAYRERLGERAAQTVDQHRGAVEKTCDAVKNCKAARLKKTG